jgi:uncharacterized RDD family membrane protein YckC
VSEEITKRLLTLGIGLLIAWAVWGNYRSRTVAPTKRYSTFGPRFWAGSVDSCVLWPIGFIVYVLLRLDTPRVLAASLVTVQSLAWLVYTVVMHARYGQTVGKMATKVRVVDTKTEGSISWRQAWLREGIPMVLSLGLVVYEAYTILGGSLSGKAVAQGVASVPGRMFWIATALPALWYLAEVLTMLTNDKRRALHDFIAGTVVIRTNIEQEDVSAQALPSRREAMYEHLSERRASTATEFSLLYGPWTIGEVEQQDFEFPTFFGKFTLAPGVRENPELTRVIAYVDYSVRVWPLMEADRFDEIPADDEAELSDVIESNSWWLCPADGVREPILVPIFCTDGGINWRIDADRINGRLATP